MRKRLFLAVAALAFVGAHRSCGLSELDGLDRRLDHTRLTPCSFPFVDCPGNSWSTGSSAAVNSHYRRILAANPAIAGRNFNAAHTGGRMSALSGQVATVVSQGVEYVTILMGANDVCTSSASTIRRPRRSRLNSRRRWSR